ncbi:MAG: DNA-3-methyladenine glycosylase family protein [Solirubrobacteraceae bacterium]
MAAETLTLATRGSFSLAASTRFLEGFAPAGTVHSEAGQRLGLAFPVEGDWRTAGVRVSQHRDALHAEVFGDVDLGAVSGQLARLLSVDVDGTAFPDVARRDPVVAALQARYPGLRPVGFWSPYEAACWAILSHRVRIVQAAAVKQQIAERHGEQADVDGERIAAFPSPRVLRDLTGIDRVSERKLAWLRQVADAALDGRLDGARLRGLEPDVALADLQALPGIGPFSAELILLRGAAHPDLFPSHERRLHDEMTRAYELTDPSLQQLRAIAEHWRPYRTWVALLLRTRREDVTHEIAAGSRGG